MEKESNYSINVFKGNDAENDIIIIRDPNNYLDKMNIKLDKFNIVKSDISKYICCTFLYSDISDITYEINTDSADGVERVSNILSLLLIANGSNWEVFYGDKDKNNQSNTSKVFDKEFFYFEDEISNCVISVSITTNKNNPDGMKVYTIKCIKVDDE